MSNNYQALAKVIMKQEKDVRAATMKEDDYFEYFAIQLIMKKYDLDDREIEDGLTDGGNDGGCDGLYLFVNNDLIHDDNTEKVKI